LVFLILHHEFWLRISCHWTIIATFMYLVTLQGSVCTQLRWSGQF